MPGDPRTPLTARVSLSGAPASATVWASATGRWKLNSFAVGWAGVTIGDAITIRESDNIVFQLNVEATGGFLGHDFGGEGFPASETNNTLRLNTESGTVNGMFVGFRW